MQRGFVTLLAVLIVGAAGLTISLTLLLLSTDAAKTSLVLEQSNKAKALANLCSEEALMAINATATYSGSSTVTLPTGSCTYTVQLGSGQNRTITSTGISGNSIKKIKIEISQVYNSLVVHSWLEVADF